jgi:hypothetical protein
MDFKLLLIKLKNRNLLIFKVNQINFLYIKNFIKIYLKFIFYI